MARKHDSRMAFQPHTTARKHDSRLAFNPTKKNEQMEVRRERYDWVDVRCSFYECECRDVYMPDEVRPWYVCVGVLPSSASLL